MKPSEARQGRWILLFTPNVAPPHPRSERLAWGLRTVSRFVDWLLYRNRPVLTGIYDHGRIFPHTIYPPVIVGARIASRLQSADRVTFVAIQRADGSAEAKRVRVYRRPHR
jgi:hypothetical protein